MSSIDAIREPITGSEDISDMCEPLHGLAQLYRAFNGRDLALMEQNWDEPGGIVMSNPIGGIKRGWNEIRAVYERIFRSGATVQVEFYDYTLHQFADIFYTVGRERGTSTQSGNRIELAIRTTRIFHRNRHGMYRQTHHHGTFDDAQLLASYQRAITEAGNSASDHRQ